MSEQTRSEIADACNTVDGVKVSPYFRQDANPGSGLVRYGGTSRPNRLGGLNTWQVVLFVHQDIADAERWIDGHVPDLLDALEPVMGHPLAAEPQQLALDSGTVPVVVIQGTREEA